MVMALRLSGTLATASLTSYQQSLPSLKSSRQFSPVLPVRQQIRRTAGRLVVRATEGVDVDVKEGDVKGDILPSGEWAESFSLLNYEDLSKHYEAVLFKPEVCGVSIRVCMFTLHRNSLFHINICNFTRSFCGHHAKSRLVSSSRINRRI
jgi:hypothetical protein